MKIILSIIFLYPLLLFGQSGIDGFVTIFWDDFNGDKLKENTYYHDDLVAKRFDACPDRIENNYYVADGLLRLKAFYTPGCNCIDNSPSDYTYQVIRTARRFKYGIFRLRAFIGNNNGAFPAYWLFGGINSQAYSSSEIDIFELWTNEAKGKSTIHLWPNDNVLQCDEWFWQSGIWSNYTFSWIENPMIVNVDSRVVSNLDINYSQGNMQIIVGNQVSFGGNPNPGDFPHSILIDYLNVDYPIDVHKIVSIRNYSSDDVVNTVFAGKNVTMSDSSGSVIVKGLPDPYLTGYNLDLIASEKIVLKPGFHAEERSSFRAWIVSPNNYKSAKSDERPDGNKYIIHPYTITEDTSTFEKTTNNSANNFTALATGNEVEKGFEIFPNPAHDYLKINIPLYEKVINIKINDILGKVVGNYKFINGSNINISNLQDGAYYLTIISDKGIRNKLFYKK